MGEVLAFGERQARPLPGVGVFTRREVGSGAPSAAKSHDPFRQSPR